MRAGSSQLHHLPKALCPDTALQGLGLQHVNFGGSHTLSPQQALLVEKTVFAPLSCLSSSVRGQVTALMGLLLGARLVPSICSLRHAPVLMTVAFESVLTSGSVGPLTSFFSVVLAMLVFLAPLEL